MKILCTFPGRHGDLLWALPTIRALARRLDQPIDLQIAGEFAGLLPVLARQDYLGTVRADPAWPVGQSWEQPPAVADEYDYVFHLGYRRWPELGLAQETLSTLNMQTERVVQPKDAQGRYLLWPMREAELDLQTPWITNLPSTSSTSPVTAGWSDCYFEYKVGLTTLVSARLPEEMLVLTHHDQTRWATEQTGYRLFIGPWLDEATVIAHTGVFLGCNAGLHVLAVAIGTPVILVEPMEARWNPIFYPVGWDGPQVTRVTGNDGGWTTDARHVRAAIERRL